MFTYPEAPPQAAKAQRRSVLLRTITGRTATSAGSKTA
jgi:hypothetical protein